MDTSTTPTCPACGFRIYNRRFPHCESCNALLPESLVYTAVERHALLVADEERDLERARRHRDTPTDTTPGSLDEAVMSAVMTLTEP